MRKEKDFLGIKEVPKDALYGIHSLRACENFPNEMSFHKEWYTAIGEVKLSCYQTYESFKNLALKEYSQEQLPFVFFDDKIIDSLKKAALVIISEKHFDQFIVPAIQGGAGTSINLNLPKDRLV